MFPIGMIIYYDDFQYIFLKEKVLKIINCRILFPEEEPLKIGKVLFLTKLINGEKKKQT